MNDLFATIIASLPSPVERRLVREYGAVLITRATPPPTVLFRDESEVQAFQSALDIGRARVGEHEIELQRPALNALLEARTEAEATGLSINPRAADAARRSYQTTVELWNRNVSRGLEHWRSLDRITPDTASKIQSLSPSQQVEVVLDLEETEGAFFGTFFDRSILYSVAAPGSSQHLTLLAFDVAEHASEPVERILGKWGWYRTVTNDLPHYTYLGWLEDELPHRGLIKVHRTYGDRDYDFWIPDADN